MQVSEGTSRRRSRVVLGKSKVVNACALGARICIAKCYTIKYGTVVEILYCTVPLAREQVERRSDEVVRN